MENNENVKEVEENAESPKISQVSNRLNILCSKCNKSVPRITFMQNKDICTSIKCSECKYEEVELLKDYFIELQRINKRKTYFCQKKDGSHSEKQATSFLYDDKCFCDECIENFKNYLEDVKITTIDDHEKKLIETKCISHNKNKFKFYCLRCKKHFCEECDMKDHINLKHNICDLEELSKSFNVDEFTKKINDIEHYIKYDVLNIKNQVVNSLKELINNIETLYENFANNNLSIIKIGRIIQDNYYTSLEFPNYNQITNMLEYDSIIDKKEAPKLVYEKLEDITKNYTLAKIYLENENIINETFIKDSDIIKTVGDAKLLKSWLETKMKKFKAKLIYKASKDGDTYDNFYDKCGNKGATVSLIETKKGRRFGGFTKAKWVKGAKSNQSDRDAFLFSFDNKRKYNVINADNAICCNTDYCQMFGSTCQKDGLQICHKFLSKVSKEDQTKSKIYDFSAPYDLNAEATFTIKDMEVYEIEEC